MSGRQSARHIIDRFGLQPLPGEGGWLRQTWVSPGDSGGPDPVGTAILYLVTPES
jgi:predicted cupin superfamily sugar epimerase